MTIMTEKAREQRARGKLARKGYSLHKSRARRDDHPEKGLYQVGRYSDQMAMTRGYYGFSARLEEVESLAEELERDPCY